MTTRPATCALNTWPGRRRRRIKRQRQVNDRRGPNGWFSHKQAYSYRKKNTGNEKQDDSIIYVVFCKDQWKSRQWWRLVFGDLIYLVATSKDWHFPRRPKTVRFCGTWCLPVAIRFDLWPGWWSGLVLPWSRNINKNTQIIQFYHKYSDDMLQSIVHCHNALL